MRAWLVYVLVLGLLTGGCGERMWEEGYRAAVMDAHARDCPRTR
jgi:hypothetical protein